MTGGSHWAVTSTLATTNTRSRTANWRTRKGNWKLGWRNWNDTSRPVKHVHSVPSGNTTSMPRSIRPNGMLRSRPSKRRCKNVKHKGRQPGLSISEPRAKKRAFWRNSCHAVIHGSLPHRTVALCALASVLSLGKYRYEVFKVRDGVPIRQTDLLRQNRANHPPTVSLAIH